MGGVEITLGVEGGPECPPARQGRRPNDEAASMALRPPTGRRPGASGPSGAAGPGERRLGMRGVGTGLGMTQGEEGALERPPTRRRPRTNGEVAWPVQRPPTGLGLGASGPRGTAAPRGPRPGREKGSGRKVMIVIKITVRRALTRKNRARWAQGAVPDPARQVVAPPDGAAGSARRAP